MLEAIREAWGKGGGGEVGRERVTASGLLLFDFSRTSR